MIALITPTGARPEQFELCSRWMAKQTYSGNVLWIIVDDAYPLSTNNVTSDFRANWDVKKVYPTPVWKGENTQARNIQAGVKYLTENYKKKDIEAVFIIEDDDYYKSVYLERMMQLFGNHQIVGETNTIYYNVVTRRFVVNPNTQHASLFQTAFSYDSLKYLDKCYYHPFIDCVMWSIVPDRYLFFEKYLSVGIKGMPGRGGIGAGHKKAFNMTSDPNLNYLRRLIGEEDAKLYERYHSDNREPQHGWFTKRSL